MNARPSVEWGPLVIIGCGILRFLYLKYLAVPPTQATIDDLDSKTFLGGFAYTTGSAYAVIIIGFILFIPLNLALIAWAFRQIFG